MKDKPHHIKKLNSKVLRSNRHSPNEDTVDSSLLPPMKRSKEQLRKQAKSAMKKERDERAPTPLTPEEKNRKMRNRVPVFDRTSNPRSLKEGARSTHKKTPPLK